MPDFSKYQSVGTDGNTDYYVADPDILIAVPKANMVDSPQTARVAVDYQTAYARQLGKKCSTLVIMSNVLSQDAESRRIYDEMTVSGLFFGTALIVTNPLSRAIAGFAIGLSKPQVPIKLFDTVEKGIDWLRTTRPKE
jgi:hypothetical protein